MGTVRQAMIFAAALAGGIALSQAPEFAQQYRQRIGGAIEELQRVVAEFDSDASVNGMTRSEALAAHAGAQPLFRDRGRSMEATIARLDLLSRQRSEFETASPLAEPIMARTKPGKLLVLSGVLVTQKDRVRAAYSPFEEVACPVRGEWVALVLRRKP